MAVVVVTGASAGVGRASVRAFARRGESIALVARGENGLEATAKEVHAAGGRGVGGSLKATVKHPGVVAKAVLPNPELDEVPSAAEEIPDFTTKAARDVDAARIRSIIDRRLACHVRGGALKFVDELRRAGLD